MSRTESVTSRLLGIDSARPLGHMEEYLRILVPLLEEQQVDFDGKVMRTRYRLEASATDMRGPSVFIAALGPRMLALAGTLASGAATWLVGQRTLAELTVPTVREAAARAGRPEPRVLASLPFLLTLDRDAGLALASEEFAFYGRLPVYQAMLERERVTSPPSWPSAATRPSSPARWLACAMPASPTSRSPRSATTRERARTLECIAALR